MRNPRSTTEIDTDQTYDGLGREHVTYQPRYSGDIAFLAASKDYDELNRVKDIIANDELGNTQDTHTDYHGLETDVTNPARQTRKDFHDALGQLAQSLDPANQSTTFVRDAFGDLTQTQDPKGNTVTISYDNLGRKTLMVDPDLGTIGYSTDARGIVWQQISPIERANGQATVFIHDTLDRLTQRQEPDLNSYWIYDNPSGNPTACGAANGMSCGKLVEAYTFLSNGQKDYRRTQNYDNLGRPSTTATLFGSLTTVSDTSTYDTWGRTSTVVRNVSGNNGGSKTYSQFYNQYGYLAQLARTVANSNGGNATVLWEAKRQDAGNRVLDAVLANGLFINREYNPNTERLDDGLITKSGTLVFHENYQYDVLGNVSNRVQEWGDANSSNYSEAFTYDALNRLATSTVFNQATQTYGYDSTGNILCKTGVGTFSGSCSSATTASATGNGNYTYGNGNTGIAGSAGPHAVTGIAGLANGSFTYDADGNMLSGAGRSYTNPTGQPGWMSFDMPYRIADGNGHSSTFTYGAEHQRSKQVRGDLTEYYADGVEIDLPNSNSSDMSHATVKTYWPAGLGMETDVNANGTATTTQRWTHDDRLGSITAITDENGNLVENMPYDAWGNRRPLSGTPVTASAAGYAEVVDNKGFTGQEELDQLGLVHLNGRIYDPFTGRFLSGDPEIQDPTHSQSYNRYTYVWNNPTNDTDPSGFEALPLQKVTFQSTLKDGTMVNVQAAINADGSLASITVSLPGDSTNKTLTLPGVGAGKTIRITFGSDSAGSSIGGAGRSSGGASGSKESLFHKASSFLFPNTTELGERGRPPEVADWVTAYGKTGYGLGQGLLDRSVEGQ